MLEICSRIAFESFGARGSWCDSSLSMILTKSSLDSLLNAFVAETGFEPDVEDPIADMASLPARFTRRFACLALLEQGGGP